MLGLALHLIDGPLWRRGSIEELERQAKQRCHPTHLSKGAFLPICLPCSKSYISFTHQTLLLQKNLGLHYIVHHRSHWYKPHVPISTENGNSFNYIYEWLPSNKLILLFLFGAQSCITSPVQLGGCKLSQMLKLLALATPLSSTLPFNLKPRGGKFTMKTL